MSDASKRLIVSGTTRPAFPRYARLHHDRPRDKHVILAPERAFDVEATALAILRLCDGQRSVDAIADGLASAYAAPRDIIFRDSIRLLQGLADKRLLRDGPDGHAPRTLSPLAQSYGAFIGGPAGLLAEITHRCPLQCPYCSNPLEMERVASELTADEWGETFRQAASMGVMQLHISGGEPTVRRDLPKIMAHAVEAGLYVNLITAAVLLTRDDMTKLADAGLDHIQVSVQDVEPKNADRISGYKGGLAKKRDVARWAHELGIGLTINAPMHRQNIDNIDGIIDFAVDVGAQRIEIAHIQYYAWAQLNRAALIPTREKFLGTVDVVEAAKKRLEGVLTFDFVIHDHYARLPKACMGGWGRSIVMVTPSGKVLPCHASQTLPGLVFDDVREKPLAEIWRKGQAFEAFRGTDWMLEPCKSCDRRDIDFGGCRCQAYAVSKDARATDPACHKSSDHALFAGFAETESQAEPPAFVYRRMGKAAAAEGIEAPAL